MIALIIGFFAVFGFVAFVLIGYAVISIWVEHIQLWLAELRTTKSMVDYQASQLEKLSDKVQTINECLQILTAKVHTTHPKKGKSK